MQRAVVAACFALMLLLLAGPGGGTAGVSQGAPGAPVEKTRPGYPPPTASGSFDFKDVNFGTGITECPQAGMANDGPKPLDQREIDDVEQYANGGNDRRTNEEFSCFPQNEPSIDTNPTNKSNIVTGINDYRVGTGSSGFAATTNGQKWYSGIIPFPSVNPVGTTQGFLVSGGDPAVVFDRGGVVYYAQIAFNRDDDTNGVTVARSLNGGFTWSRACIVHGATLPTACGGPGDPRTPGDGVVSFQHDNDTLVNGSIPFDDKEYIAAGPRPAGVSPQCYNAAHAPLASCPAGTPTSPDRLYVTWTKFITATSANIMESHSDDQGRSWSAAQPISGSAAFCAFGATANACDSNQFSTPTVSPQNGTVYVSFENFNTPDENQYLVVRSTNGGATWQGPFFVTPVFDLNFPRAGVSNRQDCTARGQQFGRIVYTNSCFRSNPGGNIVVDRRGGAFADDLYLVMSDNRNGTVFSSNSDIFLFKSNDGGSSWIGPTRVNDDKSLLTAGSVTVPPFGVLAGRDCLRPAGFIGFGTVPPALAEPCRGDFGADQWWPWVDINDAGHLNILFHDRRLDEGSVNHEWPTTRAAPIGRPGNYLVWTWGAQCDVTGPLSCLAPGAAVIAQPTAPINPGADPVPGQGPTFLGTLHNFGITDLPSNFDYSFRAGIFAGDYNNVAVTPDGNQAYGYWTDARNGRSSGGPAGGAGPQGGRNPICEQADGFMDSYPSLNANAGQKDPKPQDAMFLVTPCASDD
jgi:hypothetical protein